MIITSKISKHHIHLYIDKTFVGILSPDEALRVGNTLDSQARVAQPNVFITLSNETAAQLIVNSANEWEADGKGTGIEKAYKNDAIKLRKVAELVSKGKIKQALNMFERLDTIVRDILPDEVFNWLNDIAGNIKLSEKDIKQGKATIPTKEQFLKRYVRKT